MELNIFLEKNLKNNSDSQTKTYLSPVLQKNTPFHISNQYISNLPLRSINKLTSKRDITNLCLTPSTIILYHSKCRTYFYTCFTSITHYFYCIHVLTYNSLLMQNNLQFNLAPSSFKSTFVQLIFFTTFLHFSIIC